MKAKLEVWGELNYDDFNYWMDKYYHPLRNNKCQVLYVYDNTDKYRYICCYWPPKKGHANTFKLTQVPEL